VLLTSGYNNVNPGSGRGVLFVVDPVSGGILRRVYTGTGSLASPSGLAKMAAYVENGALDNTATHLYAGDIQGTLWRVDAGTWSVSRIATLTDSAGTRQPITTRPALGKVENQRFIVVGTGKLLEPADRESVQTQTIYGFFDKFDAAGALDSPRSVLVQQTLTNAVDSSGRRIRNASANSIDLTRDRGWYVNLPDGGERVNVDPRIVAGVAVIPSNVASVATDACQASGYGWLNFLSVRTGGRLQSGSPASYYKDSQIVGVTEIKAGGTLGVLVRTSDGKTVVDALPPNPGTLGFQGKRTSWRELAE
jgi:type IV pilus assembly protein PilY1